MRVLQDRVSKMSLAVKLAPDFAVPDIGAVDVFAVSAERRFESRKNPSGFFVFSELPPGDYVVQVRPQLFLEEERAVSLPLAGVHGPVLQVPLKPRWSFPFGAGTTLLQGSVRGPDGPVPGAAVKLHGSALESRTDQDGRFVLRFPPATEDGIGAGGFVKAADGTTAFQLSVTHAGFHAKTVAVKDIAEGAITTIRKAIELVRA